jgi:anti-anti-sigma factor
VVDDDVAHADGSGLIVYSRHDGADVEIRLWGDLDAASAGDLDREVDRIVTALPAGALVVVDSVSLTFVDSIGIASLLRARHGVLRRDARFRLRASEALRRLLALIGADELLVDG